MFSLSVCVFLYSTVFKFCNLPFSCDKLLFHSVYLLIAASVELSVCIAGFISYFDRSALDDCGGRTIFLFIWTLSLAIIWNLFGSFGEGCNFVSFSLSESNPHSSDEEKFFLLVYVSIFFFVAPCSDIFCAIVSC